MLMLMLNDVDVVWLVCRSVGWSVGRLVGWLVGWLVDLLVGWLVGMLVGLVGWSILDNQRCDPDPARDPPHPHRHARDAK